MHSVKKCGLQGITYIPITANIAQTKLSFYWLKLVENFVTTDDYYKNNAKM